MPHANTRHLLQLRCGIVVIIGFDIGIAGGGAVVVRAGRCSWYSNSVVHIQWKIAEHSCIVERSRTEVVLETNNEIQKSMIVHGDEISFVPSFLR
jgi:hypothetical protein